MPAMEADHSPSILISPSTSTITSSHRSILTDSPYTHDSLHEKPSEQLRARELLRYYTPPSAPPSPYLNFPSPPLSPETHNVPTLITISPTSGADADSPPVLFENMPIGGENHILKSSDDPALTAFAQLLALKLDCERSMISLIDRTKQYIVTETTRTLSITEPMQKSMLLVPDGLWLGCETIPSESGICVNTIQLYPENDSETHNTNKTADEAFTILEIQDLSIDPRFQNRDYVCNFPYLRFYAGTPLRTKRGYNIGSLCVMDSKVRMLTEGDRKTLGRMGKLVMQHLEMSAERNALRRNQRMAESLGRFVAGKHLHQKAGDLMRGSVPVLERDAGTLKETFSRASLLIRDALLANGVVFVDADKVYDTSSFSSRRESAAGMTRRRKSGILGWSCEIEWDETGVDEEDRNTRDEWPEAYRDRGIVPSDGIIQRMLELYPSGTILSFDQPTLPSVVHPLEPIPADPITSEHPCHIPMSPPLASGSSEADLIFSAVQDFLPDCTSVLFVPMCHIGGKHYAASFSWVCDARRVFSSDELSYMRGFMSSIMAEVSRLNTISADKAKGEFISSISHELRSPLHGVLASAEFLSDTVLNAFQRNFVETVESCGRMLLDTINHVLDFRKLNSLMQNQKTITGGPVSLDDMQLIAGGRRTPSYGAVVSPIESMDISMITEQVVESVYAGYEYKGLSSPAAISLDAMRGGVGLLDNISGLSDTRGNIHHARETVTVILDIEERDDWNFVAQPGAIRRILMNIFANALKYTDAGWVRVHLQAEDLPFGSDGTEKSKVTFTVSDSGRGISREFLKTKLFTPFSQENVLASGTGLGMSIVRQIVQLLGGDIEVKSHVNVGTEVSVVLVLTRPPKESAAELSPESPLILQARKLTEGKSISLYGFDTPASAEPSPSQDALATLRESITRYAKDWFGMNVVTGTLENPGAEVIMANESLDVVQYLEKHAKVSYKHRAPLIVLCSNVSRYRGYADSGDLFDFASKPCGPRKLAKALRICLGRAVRDRPPTPPFLLASPFAYIQSTELRPDLNHVATSGTVDEAALLPPSPPTSPAIRSRTSDFKPHVLIVEDNPINLMLLATFLKKKKYPFTKAENGLIGVQAVQARPQNFDVILMDLQMPVMSGLEAIRIIRKLEADHIGGVMKRSHIIALTGLAGSDNMDEAYDAGVDLFLTKPVTFKTVDRELDKWRERAKTASSGSDAQPPKQIMDTSIADM